MVLDEAERPSRVERDVSALPRSFDLGRELGQRQTLLDMPDCNSEPPCNILGTAAVVDELGYVPLDQEGARLLFQVMSDCYEKRSLVITTNIEFSKWGVVFGDDKLASAVIDRVMHHGRLVEFNGASKRMEHALMLGKASV